MGTKIGGIHAIDVFSLDQREPVLRVSPLAGESLVAYHEVYSGSDRDVYARPIRSNGVNRGDYLTIAGTTDDSLDVDLIAGPIGTGKTHLAIALGVEATRRRKRVYFSRVADLVRELLEARDDRRLGQLTRRIHRVPLLILDELGFVPFDRAGGQLLFNLLAERHERRSTIVTTNLSFSEWVQVFGDEKLTTALLDRLASRAHVLTTKGKSYRTRKRRKAPR